MTDETHYFGDGHDHAEEDAWDECATCGHDREDHHAAGSGPAGSACIGAPDCSCSRFVEGA